MHGVGLGIFYFAHEGIRSGEGKIISVNFLVGFVLLKAEKNKRCSGLKSWKLPCCRQNDFTVGYLQALTGWFPCVWDHLSLLSWDFPSCQNCA